jgi:hypothetical protein
MAAVNKIKADRSLLHDHTRDLGLGWSRYYHQFNHWRDYECVKTKKPNGNEYWTLEGITKKLGVVQKPSKPRVDVAPKPPIGDPLPRGNPDKLFKVRP